MTRCLERIFRGGAARLRHDVSDELPILQGCGDRRKVMLDVQDKLAILKLRAGCAVIGFEPVIEDALQGGTRSGDVEPERDDSCATAIDAPRLENRIARPALLDSVLIAKFLSNWFQVNCLSLPALARMCLC